MEGMPTVLVVDDEPDHRMMVRTIIADHAPAAHVVEAADGDEGLQVREAVDGPLLVLCDQRMPRLSGRAFFEALQGHRRPGERWVVVSSDVSDQQMAHLLSLGVDDIVEKPVLWDDMESVLCRVLDEWRVALTALAPSLGPVITA